MKICCDPCFIDLGVAMATSWRHYIFYFPLYLLVPGVFSQIAKGSLYLPWSHRWWQGLNKFYDSVLEIFWNKVLRVIKTVKKRAMDIIEGVNGVNRLATKGEKYYWLPTKRVKNYRLPTGKILTDYRHGLILSIFVSRKKSILYLI